MRLKFRKIKKHCQAEIMEKGIKFLYIKQSLNNYLQIYKMIYLQKKILTHMESFRNANENIMQERKSLI